MPEKNSAELADPPTVAAMTERWAEGGWPCRGGRDGSGNHCRVQRALSGTATLVRLPHHAAISDRALEPGGATRWRFLTSSVSLDPQAGLAKVSVFWSVSQA